MNVLKSQLLIPLDFYMACHDNSDTYDEVTSEISS